MAQQPKHDIRIVNLDTGDEFTSWESVSIKSDYLTPCDAFELEAGADIKAIDLARKLPPGARVQLLVEGHPQLTGAVDDVSISNGRQGRRVHIVGRDSLARIVDSNVDPRMQVSASTTIDQLCEKVLKEQFGLELSIFPHAGDAIEKAAGKPLGAKRKSYQAKHKRDKPLKDVTPHDNEGAYSYLARILGHHGYWLSAAQDGQGAIVAGPEYNQPALYSLTSKYDPDNRGAGRQNNVIEATFHYRGAGMPSLVYVRGAEGGAGTKGKVLGLATNNLAPMPTHVFIADRDATSKEKAERIARMFLARQMREMLTYECTVPGFSAAGAVWQVDSIVDVDDESCGVKGPMWVEARTFEKSRSGGATTKLKCIPPGLLVLDWQPDEQIPAATDPKAAGEALGALNPFPGGRYDLDALTFLREA